LYLNAAPAPANQNVAFFGVTVQTKTLYVLTVTMKLDNGSPTVTFGSLASTGVQTTNVGSGQQEIAYAFDVAWTGADPSTVVQIDLGANVGWQFQSAELVATTM
jgi:hypothetical protein